MVDGKFIIAAYLAILSDIGVMTDEFWFRGSRNGDVNTNTVGP